MPPVPPSSDEPWPYHAPSALFHRPHCAPTEHRWQAVFETRKPPDPELIPPIGATHGPTTLWERLLRLRKT